VSVFSNKRRGETVKNAIKLLSIAGLLLAFSQCASADTIWTLNDVNFDRPGLGTNTATGFFTVNSALAITSWDIVISGTNTQADFDYTSSPSVGGAELLDGNAFAEFFDFSISPNVYLDLDLASPITNAGGTIDLLVGNPSAPPFLSTIACAGCGTLTSPGSIVSSVPTFPTPEPSPVVLLGSGLLGLIGVGVLSRRKRTV
jgi:hypothetical protein